MAGLRRKLVAVGDYGCGAYFGALAVFPSPLLAVFSSSPGSNSRNLGKTSLLCVFATGTLPNEFVPAVFESYVADLELDGRQVEFALWDTMDQEDYDRLRPLSYSNSHVILLCYAIDMFESLKSVMERVRKNIFRCYIA